jgi:hypothetical protein
VGKRTNTQRKPKGPMQRLVDREALEAAQEPSVNRFAERHGDYAERSIPDPENENRRNNLKQVKIRKNRAVNLVDFWFGQGGTGFDEPQGRAVDHCRALWASCGDVGHLVVNFEAIGGGGGYERDSLHQVEALAQLGLYQRAFPRKIWDAFESSVRWESFPACIDELARYKLSVGFVASKIAEWRGY